MIHLRDVIPRPDLTVFRCDDRPWSRAEVAAQHDRSSGARATSREIVLTLAASAVLEDEGRAGDPVTARQATERVRRHHGLLSRDETEDWLVRLDLDLDDLVAFGGREATRAAVSLDRATSEADQHPPAAAAIAAIAWPTAVFTGAFEQAARELADLAAMHATVHGAGAGGTPSPAELQRAARRFRDQVIDEPALWGALERNRLEWIRLDGTQLVFDHREAACEARLCLLDGRAAAELSAHAIHSRGHRAAVSSFDPDLGGGVAGTVPGEVIGPYPVEDGWAVVAVTGRLDPTLADAEIRRLAEDTVLAAALRRERDQRVNWHVAA